MISRGNSPPANQVSGLKKTSSIGCSARRPFCHMANRSHGNNAVHLSLLEKTGPATRCMEKQPDSNISKCALLGLSNLISHSPQKQHIFIFWELRLPCTLLKFKVQPHCKFYARCFYNLPANGTPALPLYLKNVTKNCSRSMCGL